MSDRPVRSHLASVPQLRPVWWSVVGSVFWTLSAATASLADVDYQTQVKPLLEKKCYACHGALQQKADLRLDTAQFIRTGGQSGEALVAGQPDESLLIDVLTGSGGLLMPPEGEGTPLSPAEIELVRQWIQQGAHSPADEAEQTDPRNYWSYQVPQRPPVPVVNNPAWVRTPIDAFISAKHDQLGLVARVEADRATWLRRVTLDLTGLPPTREQLQMFLADQSPQAYEKVVDVLLDSPQYGERWGRHWMDIWRYSDWYGSRGINQIRYGQRHLWRWRDWIIESLNADHGYDRMIQEMLAGDELAPNDPDVVRATGYLGRNWYKFDRNVWMFDTVEYTSQAFLGLTLKCCRCHDHKYDPISQEDYYRFRAFFEPHDVRTDALQADAETEKDTGADVLKDGLARVFDKQLDVKTFLFQRGDSRSPVESKPLTPGVPPALGNADVPVTAVNLPVEAFYPALSPQIASGLLARAESQIEQIDQRAQQDEKERARLQEVIAARQAAGEQGGEAAEPVVFHDDFQVARPDVWQVKSGDWQYVNGRLVERAVTSFATLASTVKLPPNFRVRLRYRALEPEGLRSIGFSFDYLDGGNSQDVYTHVHSRSQGIQAFYRVAGTQHYPTEGIVLTPGEIKVGEPVDVEFTVRGTFLEGWLNGVKKLNYQLPVARREGSFAVWAHEGAAEFHELEIRELRPTLPELQAELQQSQSLAQFRGVQRQVAESSLRALQARMAAERAKHSGATMEQVTELARAASHAERQLALWQAREVVAKEQREVEKLQAVQAARLGAAASNADDARLASSSVDVSISESPELKAAADMLANAHELLTVAEQKAQAVETQYSPLGEVFPASSSGRRSALARWMTDRQNPRTARVAVNHIWLRHFGAALVPSVANFGLNGDQPTHPELLDWLAVELMEQGWRMKPLHRLIVLSSTYRLSSHAGQTTDPVLARNLALDPTNRWLWRMNLRRMEAESVRDSVLSAAGTLNLQAGGPEIPEAEGFTNLRRSVYFRTTPNEKMKFLEVFDLADPNACFRRRESVVPNQALALMNSGMAMDQSRLLADKLSQTVGADDTLPSNRAFIIAAFETILTQEPSTAELDACLRFLKQNTELAQVPTTPLFPAGGQSQRPASPIPHQRARENLLLVLFSHNAFVTIR